MPISVLLADDSPLVRKAIVSILKVDPEIHVFAEASNFRQTIQLTRTFFPKVIILDVYMECGNDPTLSEIKLSLADSKIIAMSFSTDEETKAIAQSYGAAEWLDKTKLADELIPAIKRCMKD
jgi:DNA-binding NarL/FixJ family response regulator